MQSNWNRTKRPQSDVISYIAIIILLAVIVVGSIVFLPIAIEKEEMRQCLTLQSQADEYETFFATEWQKNMCLQYDINL